MKSHRDNRIEWRPSKRDLRPVGALQALANRTQIQTTSDSLFIEFERALPLDTVQRAIDQLRSCDLQTLLPTVDPAALEGLKFSDCLPPGLGVHVASS